MNNLLAMNFAHQLIQELKVADYYSNNEDYQILKESLFESMVDNDLLLSELGLTDIPSVIEKMHSLEYLDLSMNRLTSANTLFPEGLKALSLYGNDITEWPQHIPLRVERLWLNENPITRIPCLEEYVDLELLVIDSHMYDHSTFQPPPQLTEKKPGVWVSENNLKYNGDIQKWLSCHLYRWQG